MSNEQNTITVTTHVGRNLLSQAALFKTPASVVWEYVVNSLQYVDPGVSPKVAVQIDIGNGRIDISDNGRGMDSTDLNNFFRMHGENIDRLAGRVGRGKFGTGKSAAFGIANELAVDTVRDGTRNVVSLSRQVIKRSDGREIPISWIIRENPSSEQNGTTVSIVNLHIKKLKTAAIIDYVERHLQAFRSSNPEVAIGNHVCVYREPEIDEEFTFEPTPSQRAILNDTRLFVKVSRIPLAKENVGIAVTAGFGNLVAMESAGVEQKECGNFLFGDIDVPELEASNSPLEPYDSTRSLNLNPQHPVVKVLVGFIGSKLEEIRGTLVRRTKEARKTELHRRLFLEADQIAKLLNKDFQGITERLGKIHATSERSRAVGTQSVGDGDDEWVSGDQQAGTLNKRRKTSKNGSPNGKPNDGDGDKVPPDIPYPGVPDEEGDNTVEPVARGSGRLKRPKGGFSVEYKNLGKDEGRSFYDSESLTIFINLDNRLVKTALGDGGIDNIAFRRLSYEIAFSEYAMGLGYEIWRNDPHIPADDLLYEVRSTINRISDSATQLYM